MKNFPWALLKFIKTHSTEMQVKYRFIEGQVRISTLNHRLQLQQLQNELFKEPLLNGMFHGIAISFPKY